MTPPIVASKKARFSAWCDRFSRAGRKLSLATRNARYIERLIREPETIGPDAVASLVMTVNLIVEARCNIRCGCCHYFATRDDAPADRRFDLTRMLELVDEVPNAIVAITGGEPLMSPMRVVEAALALLRRNRATALVTNSLPLAEPKRGELARGVLFNGLSRPDRAKLRIQCSVDIQHQAASHLPLNEYVSRCYAAIQHLTSAGFPVFTRSIVTTKEEYAFFRDQVLPLANRGVTLGASVQPDIYDLSKFAAAFHRQELGDAGARMGPAYLKHILADVKRAVPHGITASPSTLRAAPWVFIEVNGQGVKGPSGFVSNGAHHSSVLEMLRSYDWLSVADSIVPQITISQNAFLYRIDRRNRSVTLNIPYILGKVLRY